MRAGATRAGCLLTRAGRLLTRAGGEGGATRGSPERIGRGTKACGTKACRQEGSGRQRWLGQRQSAGHREPPRKGNTGHPQGARRETTEEAVRSPARCAGPAPDRPRADFELRTRLDGLGVSSGRDARDEWTPTGGPGRSRGTRVEPRCEQRPGESWRAAHRPSTIPGEADRWDPTGGRATRFRQVCRPRGPSGAEAWLDDGGGRPGPGQNGGSHIDARRWTVAGLGDKPPAAQVGHGRSERRSRRAMVLGRTVARHLESI